jgi:hypothetical protein
LDASFRRGLEEAANFFQIYLEKKRQQDAALGEM